MDLMEVESDETKGEAGEVSGNGLASVFWCRASIGGRSLFSRTANASASCQTCPYLVQVLTRQDRSRSRVCENIDWSMDNGRTMLKFALQEVLCRLHNNPLTSDHSRWIRLSPLPKSCMDQGPLRNDTVFSHYIRMTTLLGLDFCYLLFCSGHCPVS
jgi:hypothetical protein